MKYAIVFIIGGLVGFCAECWMLYADKFFSRKAERKIETLGDQARKQ